MGRPVRISFGAGLGVAVLAGCNPAGVDCPIIAAPAILLEVREYGTGFPAANGARGAVYEGSYVDSLRVVGWQGSAIPENALQMAAAFDRPGTYSIGLVKPGYQAWERTGVVVGTDRCGIQQVQLSAQLVPLP